MRPPHLVGRDFENVQAGINAATGVLLLARKVRVLEGAGPLLPTEEPYITPEERAKNFRLSCQIKVKGNMKLGIPDELFNIKEFMCEVESITDMTYDIKRLRMKLPLS